MTKKKSTWLIPAISLLCFTSAYSKTAFPAKNIDQFATVMQSQYHISQKWVLRTLQKVKFNKHSIQSITHPAEKKTWGFYKNFFLTPERIRLGIKYWHTHSKALHTAQKRFHVQPEIIVAISGIETLYGTKLGKYNALQALYTLGFHYHQRADFFQKELANLFVLCKKQHLDITNLPSSYAGAIGIPQFMPSSYNHFAISFSGSPNIDLLHNNNDAIMSIARYLHQQGWKGNEPIAMPIRVSKTNKHTLQQHIRNKPIAWYVKKGIIPHDHTNPALHASLMQLKNHGATEYWLTFNNFLTIKKYNNSDNYVMAAELLSQAIKQGYNHEYLQH